MNFYISKLIVKLYTFQNSPNVIFNVSIIINRNKWGSSCEQVICLNVKICHRSFMANHWQKSMGFYSRNISSENVTGIIIIQMIIISNAEIVFLFKSIITTNYIFYSAYCPSMEIVEKWVFIYSNHENIYWLLRAILSYLHPIWYKVTTVFHSSIFMFCYWFL